ncbi:hypothetical protein B0187_08685 [Haemophilus paracuniculus]|uniref:Uncharacterized protein n=1 Tax=Haemophilus paracuniculus TaxID=734 RepID=A0A1T0AQE1_9PAST|nr:hypothetical protein [Haemophilus paracuniculus]OOR98335.1 hypothetical protein B0187_08685 [Haemophilus paracuniculus]
MAQLEELRKLLESIGEGNISDVTLLNKVKNCLDKGCCSDDEIKELINKLKELRNELEAQKSQPSTPVLKKYKPN